MFTITKLDHLVVGKYYWIKLKEDPIEKVRVIKIIKKANELGTMSGVSKEYLQYVIDSHIGYWDTDKKTLKVFETYDIYGPIPLPNLEKDTSNMDDGLDYKDCRPE